MESVDTVEHAISAVGVVTTALVAIAGLVTVIRRDPVREIGELTDLHLNLTKHGLPGVDDAIRSKVIEYGHRNRASQRFIRSTLSQSWVLSMFALVLFLIDLVVGSSDQKLFDPPWFGWVIFGLGSFLGLVSVVLFCFLVWVGKRDEAIRNMQYPITLLGLWRQARS